MKTELLNLAKAALLLMLYMLPSLVATWYIIRVWGRSILRKDQEKEYAFLYAWISELIDFGGPTLTNKAHIQKELSKLESMPYKNPEKTEDLRNRFLLKYKGMNPDEPGCPFDEAVYNPDCQKCGLMNSENCNSCGLLDQADQTRVAREEIESLVDSEMEKTINAY